MSSEVNLKELFNGLQNEMIAKLKTQRQHIVHQGTKGDTIETTWITWLKAYLPNRYSIDKAIVIDSTGRTSQQIDIVIYDSWFTPFIFNQDGFKYIPAEGVYAVFEVKTDIYGNIGYAGEKVRSVRCLKRTSTRIINAGKPQEPRGLTKIVGGILANTNSYKDDKSIETNLKKLKEFETLDFGCIPNYGSFYADYVNSNEDLNEPNLSKRYNDYYSKREFNKLVFSNKNNSLVSFFFQLTRYLQQAIGTVAAIDLNQYSKAIDFSIDEEI